VILSLILLTLPLVWLVAAVLAVAACRAASRADARERSRARRRGNRQHGSPATRSDFEAYGFAVSQGV
jgi:hypothetical protein